MVVSQSLRRVKMFAYLGVRVQRQHVINESASRWLKDGFKSIVEVLQSLESFIAILDG